jgi:hypothetical protein
VDDAGQATKGDAKQLEVSACPANTDHAIRSAAKLAIDAGDMKRACVLLDLLASKEPARPAPRLALVGKRRRRT